MKEYPFGQAMREKFKESAEKLPTFLQKIGMSQSWFYEAGEIKDQKLKVIIAVSEALNFDFLADWYRWQGEELPVKNLLNEPENEYRKTSTDDISFQVTIRGKAKDAGKVLEVIKVESEKKGFKID